MPPPNAGRGRLALVCVPYAGVGPSAFRAWPDALPGEVEIWRVKLPGRESRFREPPVGEMEPLAGALAAALAPLFARRWALYGHSMGALVAFELARRARSGGAGEPAALMVGAMRAPQMPDRFPPLHTLPVEELKAELRRRYGVLNEALDHPEIFEALEPTIRADARLCDTYSYTPAPPFSCPLFAWGGRRDRHVSEEEIRGWGEQTEGPFAAEMLEADHFFVTTATELFLPWLRARLEQVLDGGRAADAG